MTDTLDVQDLHDFMRSYFGRKCSSPSFSPSSKQANCILYETYPFSCSLDERNRFGAAIGLNASAANNEFLGKRLSMNGDLASIAENFAVVDDWCRLHLPDKFLAAFDALPPRAP